MSIPTVIGSIIINMFSADISSVSYKFCDKIRLERFKKDLDRYVRTYVVEHDGTVLTTGDFEQFITSYHPLEHAFENISGLSKAIPKDQFIDDQINKFENAFPNAINDYYNRIILKSFIATIYDKVEIYYKNSLSKNEKYMVGVVEKIKSTLEIDIDKVGDKISRKIDSGIEDIIAILEKQSKLGKDAIWVIFSSLAESILSGNINEICTIVPLLTGKGTDLETGIKYYLELFQSGAEGSNSLSVIENVIEDDRIYRKLAEVTIYLALILKSEELLNQIGKRNSFIYEIKQHILAKNFDVFYSVETSKIDGVLHCEYRLQHNYPDYDWIVKRICALNILEQPVTNASNIISAILDDDILLDRIIIFERKVNELIINVQKGMNIDETIVSDALDLKSKISAVPKPVQCKFYAAILRFGIIQSVEETERVLLEIPRWAKSTPEIKMLMMGADINSGNYDIDKIIDICNETNQYWLLNNLLVTFVNEKPEQAKSILEKYRYVIDKDPMLFLMYAHLTRVTAGKENARALLDEYEEKYGKYLEFQFAKLCLFHVEEDLDIVTKKWLNSEYEHLSYRGNLDFISLLMEHQRYSEALQGILQIENSSGLTAEYMRIKAIALMKTNHQIEALKLFNQLFEEFTHSDEIAYYIIVLSINNKRTVADSVIEYGKKSENPSVLLVTAQYIETNNLGSSEHLILKALLRRTDSNDVSAFGLYLGLHAKGDHSEKIVKKSVDVNTVVYLQDKSGNEMTYCIHGDCVLPSDYYEWENAKHVYKETAIRFALLRKKTNDIVIIDGVEYKITQIEPLDYFFFQVSMNKLVQTNKAKIITTPVDDDGHINVEMFKEQLTQQVGDNSESNAWLEQYKDLSVMPMPFNLSSKCVRVSYTQLIDLMMQDPSVFIREISTQHYRTEDYILSIAAVIALKRIDFDIERFKERVSIASSLQKLIYDDTDIAINDNNREHVASMGVENGQLYYLETSDEVKQKYMSDALKIKDYITHVNTIVNSKDLPQIEDGKLDVKDLLGIADYDSLSIARETQRILVTAEVPLVIIANMSAIDVKTVGIAAFIANVCNNVNDILRYTEKLIEHRFLVPFVAETIEQLVSAYYDMEDIEKIQLVQAWKEILLKPLEDDSYKEALLPCAMDVISKTKEKIDNTNPIWISLAQAVLKYSGRAVRTSIANGRIYTQIIKDEQKKGIYFSN